MKNVIYGFQKYFCTDRAIFDRKPVLDRPVSPLGDTSPDFRLNFYSPRYSQKGVDILAQKRAKIGFLSGKPILKLFFLNSEPGFGISTLENPPIREISILEGLVRAVGGWRSTYFTLYCHLGASPWAIL